MNTPTQRPSYRNHLLTAWLVVILLMVLPMPGHAETDAPAFTLDPPTVVFINEIHYDNAGTDIDERIEIAAPAGTDMGHAGIVMYRDNGTIYAGPSPLGTPSGSCGDYELYVVDIAGIQNGPADGVALVNDDSNTVVQLLSYEGTFIAAEGIASGVTSTDIGVQESESTPIGHSLQVSGSGGAYDDFTWQAPAASTFGACNTGQTLSFPPTLIELASFSIRTADSGVVLTWETVVEADNAGYHIYRSSGDRVPERITPQLIGTQALPGHGARYSFIDGEGDGQAQYWLEDVDLGGVATRHGPFAVMPMGQTMTSHRVYLPTLHAAPMP